MVRAGRRRRDDAALWHSHDELTRRIMAFRLLRSEQALEAGAGPGSGDDLLRHWGSTSR